MDNNLRPLSVSFHSNFFSSLKQVEKRLKLEQTSTPAESETEESKSLTVASSCSPMFINLDQPSGSHNNYDAAQDSSEAPLAFLSASQGLTPTPQHPSHTSPSNQPGTVNKAQDDHETTVDDDDDDDDIERLMRLLGLSEELVEQKDGPDEDDDGDANSCHCEGGFYSKIAGVEGPKCRKEVKRLDGWIKHFLNGGGEEKLEPLRLAHLLLGKAAFLSEGADGGFGGLEFPSTIQEFLHNDPPSN